MISSHRNCNSKNNISKNSITKNSISKIRLIATDVDGTLLGDGGHDLDPGYYDMIRRLARGGIIFCVCSGRQYHSIRQLFDPVAEYVYFIAENGTMICKDDRILHTCKIPDEAYVPLVRDIRKIPDADMMVCGAEKTWVESGEDSFLYHFILDGYKYKVENVPDLTQIPPEKVLKISAFHMQGDRGLQELLHSHWKDELQLGASGLTWVDCCPKESGKGEALAYLQDHLGVKKEETLYFGDNMNDLPAFKHAGITGTVENAREEVKAEADIIAGCFEDLGVLRELEGLFGASEE